VRANLGLDGRPLVLLATNVIGDSLTLGRQVFSDSMTEWLRRTAQFFAQQPQTQLVVRIHPGELITKGPSVADVVKNALPEIPQHIHLVPADAQVNTYDLVEIADLGLVYTTTVGLEMVLRGVPVIAIGNTHYRNRGFTLDPDTWENYFDLLGKVLLSPTKYRPTQEHVNQAWNYAYRFFFEYPHLFPWHIVINRISEWPVSRVLGAEVNQHSEYVSYLVGEPIEW
jgi:capsule polysaccharide export protein KpsC/LpsZ